MGSTFVTLGRIANGETDRANELGFWMHDAMLELWLRFLALQIEEPVPDDPDRGALIRRIRDQWLLASRFHFVGCVPHGLKEAAETDAGVDIVRRAVLSAASALERAPDTLSVSVLNLMGFEDPWKRDVETERLRDVARAFLDLLDGRITSTARETDYMPGWTLFRIRSSPLQ